jgi:hypothetical protein
MLTPTFLLATSTLQRFLSLAASKYRWGIVLLFVTASSTSYAYGAKYYYNFIIDSIVAHW